MKLINMQISLEFLKVVLILKKKITKEHSEVGSEILRPKHLFLI